MKFRYIKNAVDYYESNLNEIFGIANGYDDLTIKKAESELNISFPSAYVEFLKWYGKTKPGIFAGSDIGISRLQGYKDVLDEILIFLNLEPPEQANPVAFLSHQGYIVDWFYCDDDKAGPIYSVSDGEGKIDVVAEDFNEYLLKKFISKHNHILKNPGFYDYLSG